MRWIMRSKLHKATVTEANLNYVGSITIDEDLLDAVGLWPGEKVLVVSNSSGARLETYTIAGERGSGDMCVNGAAAHLISEGEEIIVMGFELSSEQVEPEAALILDKENRSWQMLVEKPRVAVESLVS